MVEIHNECVARALPTEPDSSVVFKRRSLLFLMAKQKEQGLLFVIRLPGAWYPAIMFLCVAPVSYFRDCDQALVQS